MANTPGWETARSGQPGDLVAVNHAAQVNQFLGTHNTGDSYYGAPVATSVGGTRGIWIEFGNANDWSQPFTMSGTTVGRVLIPAQPHGNAADLLVSLMPDNGSGSPNTNSVLASTLVPAQITNQLTASGGLSTGGPLALADYNYMKFNGGMGTNTWSSPSGSANGVPSYPTLVTSGNYSIFLGGTDPVSGNSVTTVFTVEYLGSNQVALPISQPALPQASFYGAAAATTNEIIYMGGQTGATFVNAVWVAGWNSNTGTLSTWSKQTSLPITVGQGAGAAYGETVYYTGGTTNGSNTGAVNNVYYATLSNGQLNAWSSGPILPQPLYMHIMQVVGNWLIVTGGLTAADTVNGATYYAPINSDGSLGGWHNGPTLPTPIWNLAPGSDQTATDSCIILGQGITNPTGTTSTFNFQTLTVTANGPALSWVQSAADTSGAMPISAFYTGANGEWEIIIYDQGNSRYWWAKAAPVPMVSVPLYATGLTNGATYHIFMQVHQYASSNDYLGLGALENALSSNLLTRTRFSPTWSTWSSGYSMPLMVFDDSTAGRRIHSYADSNPITAVVGRYDMNLEDWRGRPLGYVEVTQRPNDPRDINPTFTTGTSPWTATNCTLTQSSAQTHGGYPFSGLITPNGTSASVYISSELIRLDSNVSSQYYMFFCWAYSTLGTTAFSLESSWYNNNQAFISTTGTSAITLTAATWTLIINYLASASGAEYGQIVPTLGGTPSSSNTLYLSDVAMVLAPENTTAIPSAVQFTYGTNLWPSTGVIQLV